MWKDPMFTGVFFTNTLPSAPGTERCNRKHNRVFLRGGPSAVGFSPLLFLSHWSGRHLRHWVQHYLGPGSISLRWVASGRAWAAVLGLGGWLNTWVGANWRQLEAAVELEPLGQEASHCLGRLLCGCEAFSEVLYCRTKQACGGDRRVDEGDLIRILHLRQVREGRQIVAGNPWTSCCFESRIAKILLSSLKEKKSEEPWRMPALYSHITHPIWWVLAGFPAIWYAVQLHCHHWFICSHCTNQ